jgi:hypothetical protein
MARARVRGFQGSDYSAPDRVLACAKHWVAYGAAEAGRDYNIYYSAFIMLVGAEVNQVIEEHIPGGKNEGEKIPEDDRRPDVHRLNGESGKAR